MFSKTTNIIIGLLLVTGAGFIFAAGRDNPPAENSAMPLETPAAAAPDQNGAMPAVEGIAVEQADKPAASDNSEPEFNPESAEISEVTDTKALSESETKTASQTPELPEQKPAPSPPASTAGLAGLWHLERELTIDNSTGNIIKEEHPNIYTSFKDWEQCLHVGGSQSNLFCDGGYAPYSIDENGIITDADGFDNYRYKNGALEAEYIQGGLTKRQIFKKVSPDPAP